MQHSVATNLGAWCPHCSGKAKRNALLKALATALKSAASGKKTKWHEGDSDKLAASTVVGTDEFLALFPGVEMSKKGVTTSFSISSDQITAAFGDMTLKVATWSKSYRAFQKAYQTGSKPVSVVSAEGKYSSNTSTLTMKFNVRVAGSSVCSSQSVLPLSPVCASVCASVRRCVTFVVSGACMGGMRFGFGSYGDDY